MYSVSPKMSQIYSSNEELNNLLDRIDRKIAQLATNLLNNYRFGFNRFIDLDLYEDLLTYKEILLDKLLGCNCLNDAKLILINSKIRKLII